MNFIKNTVSVGFWRDYAGIVHINQNAEVQYLKQFPIYNFNQMDVYTELQKTNNEIRTLYSIENARTFYYTNNFILQPNFVVNNNLTQYSLISAEYDANTDVLLNHTVNNEQSLTCIYTKANYINADINPILNSNVALLQALCGVYANGFFVHIFQHFFEIIYIKHNSVQFYNSYDYTHENDVAYYMANVAETLMLDLHNTEVYVLGRVLEGSEIIQHCKTFAPNVCMLEIPHLNNAKALPQYQHFAILSLALCA